MTTELPQDVLQRVERVFRYHQATRYTYEVIRKLRRPDPAAQPNPYRLFPEHPKIALPSKLLDAPVSALAMLNRGLEALVESQLRPPQDLKTLASWLYMAYGLTHKKEANGQAVWARTCPSDAALYPSEIYVAAFGMKDLEPGLYHFSPREFALRQLRRGPETLVRIKRGRPDLEFLKTVPAALLVSTIFCRSAWKHGDRAYRNMLLDAGHLVENIVHSATGLGMQTLTRLMVNDNTMRELIGLGAGADAPFDQAEAVQAMVVWTEPAEQPIQLGQSAGASSPGSAGPGSFPPIPRQPLTTGAVAPHPALLAVHHDCVAPGIALRGIRPPLTELSPLPETVAGAEIPINHEAEGGLSLRQVLFQRRSPEDFLRRSLSRDQFLLINRLAFRSGTYYPMLPPDPHLAFVRPFWIVQEVTGLDGGIWYYDPPKDHWLRLRMGDYRIESKYLCIEQNFCGNASAVCFMAINLHALLMAGIPDTYRLAHLEAGIAGQRLHVAAAGLDLGCRGVGVFYDEEARDFLGLAKTGWHILYAVAVGVPADEEHAQVRAVSKDTDSQWRDSRG